MKKSVFFMCISACAMLNSMSFAQFHHIIGQFDNLCPDPTQYHYQIDL